MDMSRIRIEGLLAAFPKLVGSGKQHTYVETENVRYVYQPMETLFLLLVTNKQSNILEDLETLRLISKLVSTCSHLLVNPPTLFCYFCCCVLFSSFLSCESTAGG
jgi:Na+/H+ antiporter NhaC